MEQLELFDYRRDYIFNSENQVAHWYDILKETEDSISYSEHIDPKKGFAICGMEYEEYVDVKKDKLNGLSYDDILIYLKNFKKEERLEKYKKLYTISLGTRWRNFAWNFAENAQKFVI